MKYLFPLIANPRKYLALFDCVRNDIFVNLESWTE